MKLVQNSDSILDSIAKIRSLNNGFITNFYPDFNKIKFWIEERQLYKAEYKGSEFYVREQDTFFYLLYISSNPDTLSLDIDDFLSNIKYPFVVEIISQKEKEEESVLNIFKLKKFEPYTTLVRLNMKTPQVINERYPVNIRKAKSEDLQDINNKLHSEFDKYSEQLPSLKELDDLIQKEFVLIYKDTDKIAGFIVLENYGLTQHLRYWFVDPGYRDRKVGSALFNAFLICGKETKRQILWCRSDNENALKRYEHYGYQKENMYDYILKIEL